MVEWILVYGFIAFLIALFLKKQFHLEKGIISQYLGSFIISWILIGLTCGLPFFCILAFPVIILFNSHFDFFLGILTPKDNVATFILFIYYFCFLFAIWPRDKHMNSPDGSIKKRTINHGFIFVIICIVLAVGFYFYEIGVFLAIYNYAYKTYEKLRALL